MNDSSLHPGELEAELRRTRAELSMLLEVAPLPEVRLTARGEVAYWSDLAERMFGWTAKETLQRAFLGFAVPPAEAAIHQAAWESRDSAVLEGHWLHRDGHEFKARFIYLRTISATEIVLLLRDQPLLPTQLESTERRLELALNYGNVGLWDWNAQTGEVYFSDSYKAQLGYPAETPWHRFEDWEQSLHPDDRAAALGRIESYFADPSTDYSSQFRLLCRGGAYRTFIGQGKASFATDGRPLRMLGVHIDVTEATAAADELERLNDALGEANNALQVSNVELQQFAYVASHDLQTPLRAIAGFAQFLHNDYHGQFDEAADDYLMRIIRAAKRMQQLIDDLLAYSRVESRAAAFQSVSMDEVVAEAIEIQSVAVEESGAKVYVGDMPEVLGDRSQLIQLVQNLIGNGIKYSLETPVIAIRASELVCEGGRGGWRIEVQDEGIGIAPKHHERVFEVFQRLHSSRAFPGTGIGLAVCKRIVQRHQGQIGVESDGSSGSTFWFTLSKAH